MSHTHHKKHERSKPAAICLGKIAEYRDNIFDAQIGHLSSPPPPPSMYDGKVGLSDSHHDVTFSSVSFNLTPLLSPIKTISPPERRRKRVHSSNRVESQHEDSLGPAHLTRHFAKTLEGSDSAREHGVKREEIEQFSKMANGGARKRGRPTGSGKKVPRKSIEKIVTSPKRRVGRPRKSATTLSPLSFNFPTTSLRQPSTVMNASTVSVQSIPPHPTARFDDCMSANNKVVYEMDQFKLPKPLSPSPVPKGAFNYNLLSTKPTHASEISLSSVNASSLSEVNIERRVKSEEKHITKPVQASSHGFSPPPWRGTVHGLAPAIVNTVQTPTPTPCTPRPWGGDGRYITVTEVSQQSHTVRCGEFFLQFAQSGEMMQLIEILPDLNREGRELCLSDNYPITYAWNRDAMVTFVQKLAFLYNGLKRGLLTTGESNLYFQEFSMGVHIISIQHSHAQTLQECYPICLYKLKGSEMVNNFSLTMGDFFILYEIMQEFVFREGILPYQ